jgi:membrane protein
LTPILSPRVALDAYYRFLADDGWAIASHIALSALMALFPFIIVVTTLAASSFGSKDLADEVATLLLEAGRSRDRSPEHNVLTTTRGEISVGAVFAVYFSSNGIEACGSGSTCLWRAGDPGLVPAAAQSISYVLIGVSLWRSPS